MDSGCESYRRFREEGDQEALAEIIRVYRDGLFCAQKQKTIRKISDRTEYTLTAVRFFGKIKRLYSGDRPIGPFNSEYSITSPPPFGKQECCKKDNTAERVKW